ncbi:Ribonuclease H-like domain [Cinara cedri]|uniref:Ribonuclease H-like domain n=1 Tax=Cinara cedri TaxID=506608 RepID=A0A5E4NB19_9HEMI|nr:Ribonuclease H-like domain [Cinara cedri]
MKEIVIKPLRTHHYKPLYVKINEIQEEISVNINNTIPIESPYPFRPWHTNLIEVNTDLKTFYKNFTPHRQIINSFHEIINNNFNSFYQICTDASKAPNQTGFAITHTSQNILFKLPQFTSIYTAEILAIFEALSTYSLSVTHSNILILSDSMSAISAKSNTNTKCNIA